jgi:hypothetical protein
MKQKLLGKLNLLAWIYSSACILSISLLLASCGSGGGAMDSLTPLQKGVFVDSPVEGLNYRTPSLLGVTDHKGTFRFQEGEQVTFFIGDLELGQSEAKAIISPVDLVAGATGATDQTVTNLCRLLQTLDVDGDPANGIVLSAAINTAVAGRSIDFTATPEAFGSDPELLGLLDDLNNQGALSGGERTLVSADQARSHLLASLGLDCSANDPACPTGEGGFESSLRELINDYRQQTGLGHLVFDPLLYQLAQTHSTNMQDADILNHDGFQDRYDASGYRTCVENVAWNYPTPESLLSGWQNSSGHDRNLLHQNIGFVGVARTGPYTTFFACGN